MARIRLIEINHFRSIKSLNWSPENGVNCLIGPGDSGKSTILDAIDLCLGARRGLTLSDTDFYGLDVSQPIVISLTLGDLSDRLKNLEYYGDCLRGYHDLLGEVEDEPRQNLETVLTVRLTVTADLEPVWSLYSDRTALFDPPKMLQWKDRTAIAPVRLGHHPNSHLSWTRGSVLNRLSENRTEIGLALVDAAREARVGFGAKAAPQLAATLTKVTEEAHNLGIPVGSSVTALLDAHAVSFGDGAISLHSEAGVPLRNLGTGSTRLLIAGLHRVVAETANIVLIDEVEHGLEPHRINRLLDSLGAKDKTEPLQVFMTTHSPVVLRELNGDQLRIVRSAPDKHDARWVGTTNEIQAAIRIFPEAFLAKTVLVCEGASEIGLIRGIDRFMTASGNPSLQAHGVAYVDAAGGDADRAFIRANVFQRLGYRVAVLQDNDKTPSADIVKKFVDAGGFHLAWRNGRALEDELFASLPAVAILALLTRAQELTEEGLVNSHIVTTSQGKSNLALVLQEGDTGDYSGETRELLGRSSRIRKAGWFKSISKMEAVSHEILCAHWNTTDTDFTESIRRLLRWSYGQA
ncbi:ATP-dependent nuclease [Alcaligenes sp. SMD-FA]|uniref:ATP-dependent nuclease n=1 Tax=Alcaligenes sp. SMD-FA TaxID=2991054 RepID=UPI002227449A|nr:AAA family ATPase [Alcaligenes sp. SMD-FA]UYY85582.1 AAA family ATPase [Alcaligenes sp. SMD-FA]